MSKDEEVTKIATVDLRSITRESHRCVTRVQLFFPGMSASDSVTWLIAGQTMFRDVKAEHYSILQARLANGVTDEEHDSAYAFQLPLIGLCFTGMDYNVSRFVAHVRPVHPDRFGDDFRVPRRAYDPGALPGASLCARSECKATERGIVRHGHVVVPSGHFGGPPFDRQLWEAVRGLRVTISIGPAEES